MFPLVEKSKRFFVHKYPEGTRPRPVALAETWETALGFTWDDVVNGPGGTDENADDAMDDPVNEFSG